MANKGINVKISGDSKDAESALKRVEAKANELSKKIKKTGQAAASLNNIVKTMKGAFSAASAAVGKAVDVMKDLARGGRFDTM